MGFLIDESYNEEEDRTKWRQDPGPVIGEIHIADGSDILLMYCYHNGEVLLESASRLLKKPEEGGACQR